MLSLLSTTALGCTDFYMPIANTSYRLSVRTMDLGTDGGWVMSTVPRGGARTQTPAPPVGEALNWTVRYGSVVFTAPESGFPAENAVGEALNEKGLSCGALALVPSKTPEASATKPNLHSNYVCQYVVDSFASVAEARAGLAAVQLFGHGYEGKDYVHWVLRDATGVSLVLESPAGELLDWVDENDDETGFGIMTNEPGFAYHLANVKHLFWKRTLARAAVPVPGSWYPEDRFMRAYMVKSAMPPPSSLQQAVAQAVGTLNVVTVPMGAPPGTDSGKASGELGDADHSLWGVVRDHAEPTLYWRSAANPSLQRLRLADVDLSAGAAPRRIVVSAGPWFHDAAATTVEVARA